MRGGRFTLIKAVRTRVGRAVAGFPARSHGKRCPGGAVWFHAPQKAAAGNLNRPSACGAGTRADGEFLTGVTTIQTMARPDLGLGKFPDTSKVRFFEIMFFSVRQGQEAKMDSIMKTYAAVRKRVSPDAGYRVYTVVAGMPDPTYIVIQTVADYGEFDRTMAEHAKVFEAATPEETASFNKWGEAASRSEVNRFRVDPMMSYVPKEVRASDAEFWMAK
jgi:hypothetical protein